MAVLVITIASVMYACGFVAGYYAGRYASRRSR